MFIQCLETQEWIEEEVHKPVSEWVEKQEKQCKKLKWYDPRRWLCSLVTILVEVITWVVVKVGKWIARTVCKMIYAVVSLIEGIFSGIFDVIAGIFTLDWRRILDGLISIGSSIINTTFNLISVLLGGDTIDYMITEYERGQLRDHVRKLLEAKYSGEELQNIKHAIRLDHGAFGYRITMQAMRSCLHSDTVVKRPSSEDETPNLVLLHEEKKINLRELCGFEFTEGFGNRKRYKTLKKEPTVSGSGYGEFENPISLEELDLYLSSRGTEGPKFTVLCMRDKVLRTKLDAADIKARELGLIPTWIESLVEVSSVNDIIHTDNDGVSLVKFLKEVVGRTDVTQNEKLALAELCSPVVVGVFRYRERQRGLSACLKGSPACQKPHNASGATFIDNRPDLFMKYVPIHELGHYFGLCHVDGLDRVMYTTEGQSAFSWGVITKLLYRKNVPSFTLDEAKQTWDYIVAHFPAACLGGFDEQPVVE